MGAGHLTSAWRYRSFVLSAIRGELRSRFARSKIGWAWFVLHPLAMASIYAVVLSKVLGAKLAGAPGDGAYAVYLMAGIAGWSLFAEITNRCMTVFLDQAAVLKKISFPRVALPLIVLGSALLNHAFLLLAVAFVASLVGYPPSLAWAGLLLGVVLVAGLGVGVGLFLGVLNVFVRDVGQVFAVMLQLLFWLTPVVYPLTILPQSVATLVRANPLTSLIGIYQDAILYGRWPSPEAFIGPALLALVLLMASLFTFRRASAELVDAL